MFSNLYLCIYHPIEIEVDFSKQFSAHETHGEEKYGLDEFDEEAGDDKGDKERNVTDRPFPKVHHDEKCLSRFDPDVTESGFLYSLFCCRCCSSQTKHKS